MEWAAILCLLKHLPVKNLPESENLTSQAWKSWTSSMIEWGSLCCSPTVCCRAGGAVGLVWCLNPQGLDKDTWPVWCSVYLSINTSMLQLWKVYKALIQPSHYGTWCQVTDPMLPSASIRSCQTNKKNAGDFNMINPLAEKSCLQKDGYGQSDVSAGEVSPNRCNNVILNHFRVVQQHQHCRTSAGAREINFRLLPIKSNPSALLTWVVLEIQ